MEDHLQETRPAALNRATADAGPPRSWQPTGGWPNRSGRKIAGVHWHGREQDRPIRENSFEVAVRSGLAEWTEAGPLERSDHLPRGDDHRGPAR